MMIRAPRGNKYGAKKSPCRAGHIHASSKEARRCTDLHLLQRAGEITDLQTQRQFYFVIDGKPVKHPGGRRVGFNVDFSYVENGREIAEDSKGVRTEAFVLRIAIFRALFPHIEFRES